MTPSAREVECFEAACRCRPVRIDAVDPRQARPLGGRLLQQLEIRPAPLGDQLDGPVVVVANPSKQSELLGPAKQEIAKPDALDITSNYNVKPLHDSKVSAS